MPERPAFNFDNSGNAIAPATPSPETVVREMQTQDAPSQATQQLAEPAAPIPSKSERLRDVTSGQFVKTPLVRPDWSTPSQEIGAPGEPVAAGIGVGMSLVAKMQGMPGGFEENYGQMLGAILDEGDKLADPRPAIAAWDDSPGSLQTKIANDYLMYPGGDIEARYRRVKAKSTLMEAAALDRLMRLVRPR